MCAHLHHTGKAAPALCVYVSVLVPVTNGPPLYFIGLTGSCVDLFFFVVENTVQGPHWPHSHWRTSMPHGHDMGRV